MKETLLEKAKKIYRPQKQRIETTNEHIELSIAWAKEEITLTQLTKAVWGTNCQKNMGGRALYSIAVWLKEGFKKGIIKSK